MRVENWRAKGVFNDIAEAALEAANAIMDDHVAAARLMCPVGKVERPDGFISRQVTFIPKTGKNKGKEVSFTAQTWTGRKPGSLRATIRRVNKHDRPGNIRVYAGNHKVFYARFVEFGTSRTAAKPFLRPSFHAIKNTIIQRIEGGVAAAVPEVKR
jgi:HK97 gp10 family phage protein